MTAIWNDTEFKTCNKLKGTDGTLFAPDLGKSDPLFAFEPQLCRTVFFRYKKETDVRDIDTYRFAVPEDYFDNPLQNDNNMCYCMSEDHKECDHRGVLDISTCTRRTFGAPIVMSAPYFLYGEEDMLNFTRSKLIPKHDMNYDNYGTYIDVEPMTGTVLNAVRRLQMSLKVTIPAKTDLAKPEFVEMKKAMPQLFESKVKTEYIIPVFWIEEKGEADQSQADDFNSMVTNKRRLGNGLSIAVVVVGALMLIASIYLFIRHK